MFVLLDRHERSSIVPTSSFLMHWVKPLSLISSHAASRWVSAKGCMQCKKRYEEGEGWFKCDFCLKWFHIKNVYCHWLNNRKAWYTYIVANTENKEIRRGSRNLEISKTKHFATIVNNFQTSFWGYRKKRKCR